MNRRRLNQMLEVLLFPICDPGQGEKDVLLLCYEAYQRFMDASHMQDSGISVRTQRNYEYRKRQKELVTYLVERNHGRVKSEDFIQMLCSLYYPMDGIAGEMERIRELCRRKHCESRNVEIISSFYLQNVSRISRALITYRDGVATVRQWTDRGTEAGGMDLFGSSTVYNKIEIWNLLCRMTAPDLYIAVAAVDYGLGPEALYGQQANVALADKLLVKSLQKGVAENHMHFYAGYDYEIRWLHYMDLAFAETAALEELNGDAGSYARLEMALFRLLAAVYTGQEECEGGFGRWLQEQEEIGKEVKKIVYDLYKGIWHGTVGDDCRKQVHDLYRRFKSGYAVYECDYLLGKVYRDFVEYKTSSEFLLLYFCYRYTGREESDTFFSRLFLQYIRLKNGSFHAVCEQHVLPGLKYFQRKYSAGKRTMGEDILPARDMMLEVFRSQAKVPYLKKLEIRVAPQVDGADLEQFDYGKCRKIILQQLGIQVSLILGTYKRFLLESVMGVGPAWEYVEGRKARRNGMDPGRDEILGLFRRKQPKVPLLGIVFHFIKSEELEDLSGDYCWRRAVKSTARRSTSRLHKRYFMRNIAMALEEMRSTVPWLSEYIVGVDAASDENAMEPWMFAPAYRSVRNHACTKPVMEVGKGSGKFQKIQNIGFTYHVGEDFRHILSGLRHIDEVLEEFGYKAGDRLGHALALGTDAVQWIRDNEMVPVPLLEHMENLLWIWGLNAGGNFGQTFRTEVLEDRILSIAQRLYPYPETITVKMLYGAYRKKFAPDHKETAQKIMNDSETHYTFCCNDMMMEQCYNGWTEDKLLVTNYCPVFASQYEKIELVLVKKEEAEVFRQLQEYLIRKVERMGIYIETNPTSNLSIGDFSQMDVHPIFYLNQKKSGCGHHVLVNINSDDPAVFNTNVENEFAYIYYAAEKQGYAKSEILEWIDRIRQYGMDASFIQKEKSAEQIFLEVEEMIEGINRRKWEFPE